MAQRLLQRLNFLVTTPKDGRVQLWSSDGGNVFSRIPKAGLELQEARQ